MLFSVNSSMVSARVFLYFQMKLGDGAFLHLICRLGGYLVKDSPLDGHILASDKALTLFSLLQINLHIIFRSLERLSRSVVAYLGSLPF